MSREPLESMLGVYARAFSANRPDQLIVAQLPDEDSTKKKVELVKGYSNQWQPLVAKMFSGAGGRIKPAEVPIDAMSREIREEMAGLSTRHFELLPDTNTLPLIVFQKRQGRRVVFCCLAFNCLISARGIEYLQNQHEMKARQLTMATPEYIKNNFNLRPLLAATLRNLANA